MPAIFGDHMVLQQSTLIPVWGKAAPGEEVTVKLGEQTVTTAPARDGRWMVKLQPLPVETKPLILTVSGRNTLTFQDVLVGEVWLAAGQSNMEFGMGNTNHAAEDIPKANHPLIRLFLVDHKASFSPEDDVPPANPKAALVAHWCVCTPDSVSKQGGWNGFSAVAYYFGREIHEKTGHPVGLIASYWGGQRIQSFMSIESMRQSPVFQEFAAEYDKAFADAPAQKAAYPKAKAEYDDKEAKWDETGGAIYKQRLDAWRQQRTVCELAGKPTPPRPEPALPEPLAPPDGMPHEGTPSNLFNGMISPLIPYAMKGVLWYQGESNVYQNPCNYSLLLGTMIRDWRERWQLGDFPFLIVQLANFGAPANGPVSHDYLASLRDQQRLTLAVPNTALAITIDVGEAYNQHPRDKADVGHRLALAARHLAYGEQITFCGPLYDFMNVEGDHIRIHFRHAVKRPEDRAASPAER